MRILSNLDEMLFDRKLMHFVVISSLLSICLARLGCSLLFLAESVLI